MKPTVSTHHPAAMARGDDLARTAAALASRSRLPLPSGPHPAVALAVQAVRGSQRRNRSVFAAAYGLEINQLTDLESGRVGWSEVPTTLRALTPLGAVVDAVTAQGLEP